MTDFEKLKDLERKNRFVDLARQTCEEPGLIGATLHYLIVAEKKDLLYLHSRSGAATLTGS